MTKLDNARKLRHIYFINPDDVDFKDAMKNARKKLEPSMESATHCNVHILGHGETSGENKSNTRRLKNTCTLGVRKLTKNCLVAGRNIN